MQNYELRDFLQEFLKHHQLSEFNLVFEPIRRGARRSKRGTSMIQAKDPSSGAVLPKTRSVKDLLAKLYGLAPETGEWLESNQHTPRMYDDVGVRIHESELLGDLRTRSAARVQEGERRSRKILLKAIQSCDRLLEAADVNRVIRSILTERQAK